MDARTHAYAADAAPASAAPTLHGNYVLLRAGNVRLLLAQHEVGALEYLPGEPLPADVRCLFRLDDERGEHRDRRFIALSSQLRPLAEFPHGRFVYTTLGDAQEDLLGWCWDEVRILPELECTPQPLPPVLRATRSPITRFAELDKQLVFLCNARQLRQYALDLEA